MKCCHGVKPRGRRVTWVEGASGPRLSKHNHFLYFEHTQGLKDGLPVPDCQSRCHCKLSSLMAPDCQRLWGESTKENSSSSWQAGLLTNYLFFFSPTPRPLFRAVSRGSSPACDLRLRHSASSLLSSNAASLLHERTPQLP